MIDLHNVVPHGDILFITLDTLRYDVAVETTHAGRTPVLSAHLTNGEWEKRHTPGSFTLAAHHAFFAGFLPTPAEPGLHPRLFAAKFHGSETTGENTFVFDAPDIVAGLRQYGYHTACVGGTGFFNKQTPLGNVLPALFDESHWSPDLGVTARDSIVAQVECAVTVLRENRGRPVFLFVNVSAMHQPNYFYLADATQDGVDTQSAALSYVDQHLPPLLNELAGRGSTLCIVSSDHGTAYGEDGYTGHRLAHSVVWTVPYAEFMLGADA